MNIKKIKHLSNIKHKEWMKVEHIYCREESKGFDREAGDKNLKSIKDGEFILKVKKIVEPLEKEVGAVNQEVGAEVDKYLAK